MEDVVTGEVVCLSCAFANLPNADFCEKCDAPITTHAFCDPFDTIKTQGWMYRKATQSPKKPIVVFGIWMLVGPVFCFAVYGLLEMLKEIVDAIVWRDLQSILQAPLLIGMASVMAYFSGKLLYRVTTNFLLHRRNERMQPDDDGNDEAPAQPDDEDDADSA